MTALVAGAIIALVAANIYLYVQVDHVRTDMHEQMTKMHDSIMAEVTSLRDSSSVTTASQQRHLETLKEELETARNAGAHALQPGQGRSRSAGRAAGQGDPGRQAKTTQQVRRKSAGSSKRPRRPTPRWRMSPPTWAPSRPT